MKSGYYMDKTRPLGKRVVWLIGELPDGDYLVSCTKADGTTYHDVMDRDDVRSDKFTERYGMNNTLAKLMEHQKR